MRKYIYTKNYKIIIFNTQILSYNDLPKSFSFSLRLMYALWRHSFNFLGLDFLILFIYCLALSLTISELLS